MEIAAEIPADIIHINRLYIGITRLYNPIPSGPNTWERYIEKINPKTPVVILDAVNKNEFLKKLSCSFSKVSSPLCPTIISIQKGGQIE